MREPSREETSRSKNIFCANRPGRNWFLRETSRSPLFWVLRTMIKVHVVVKTIIIIYRSSVNNYTYRQQCFDQEAKPQIWVFERSLCFHKKTLRYTCSCKSYAVFSASLSLSLFLSLSVCVCVCVCVNILMQPRKVPVLLR